MPPLNPFTIPPPSAILSASSSLTAFARTSLRLTPSSISRTRQVLTRQINAAPLTLRLVRRGRTNNPAFDIVVIQTYKPNRRAPVETVGKFDPIERERDGVKCRRVEWNVDRVRYWVNQGVTITAAVRMLLKRGQLFKPEYYKVRLTDTPNSLGKDGPLTARAQTLLDLDFSARKREEDTVAFHQRQRRILSGEAEANLPPLLPFSVKVALEKSSRAGLTPVQAEAKRKLRETIEGMQKQGHVFLRENQTSKRKPVFEKKVKVARKKKRAAQLAEGTVKQTE